MIQPVKGTHDLYGSDAELLRYVENTLLSVAELYGYKEIILPVFEYTEVFSRGTGEGSDVVRKEMYTFLDKGDRSLTLRPEFTAGVARSVISNRLYINEDLPLKLYYRGPLFRYERPQLGRYRQFNQFGIEAIGEDSARLDAETILIAVQSLSLLGFKDVSLHINSLGDAASREAYHKALTEYFSKHIDEMCDDCKERLRLNPLRILDCKVQQDQEIAKRAPKISEYLSSESEKRFYDTLSILNDMGVTYVRDEGLVRGLDYYSEVVFEVHAKAPSGLDYGALLGGGHYSSLLRDLGGPDLPGVGFAMGLERLCSILKEEGGEKEELDDGIDIYVMPIGKENLENADHLAQECRMYGYRTEVPFGSLKFSTLFKKAEKRKAKFALIFGEEELSKKTANLKNLAAKTQTSISLENLEEELEKAFHEYEGCHNHHDDEEEK